jgi:diguanylate cyclase (GGDEF)-like protein
MNEQLEQIASLELITAADQISREMQEKLTALRGMLRGGKLEAAKLEIRLDQSERVCQECTRIWVDLLETKNGGCLTREDVDFIVGKVREVVERFRRNLAMDPEPPRLASAAKVIVTRLDGIIASIKRHLEVRIRRQQAFSKRNTDTQKEARTSAPAHVDVSVPEEPEELPGKKLLLGDLQQRLDVRGLVSVLFIDLDGFKGVNDTLGHAEGDKCLIRTLRLISNVVVGKGKLYRPGGDEFVVLLPNFSREEAKGTAERIRASIDGDNPGGTLKVTVSIGVASSQSVRTAEDLIDRADQAMYSSKKTKNCVSVFSEEPGTVSNDLSPTRGGVPDNAIGRIERRVDRSIAVHLLSNQTSRGIELTSMDNMSAHGACVLSEHPLQPGLAVEITDLHSQSAIHGEVVHCEKYDDRYFIGLKLQGLNPFWELAA